MPPVCDALLLALRDSEAMIVRRNGLDAEDLAAIGIAHTPATRLGYPVLSTQVRIKALTAAQR